MKKLKNLLIFSYYRHFILALLLVSVSSCSNEDIDTDPELIKTDLEDTNTLNRSCPNSNNGYDWLTDRNDSNWKLQYAIGSGSSDYREAERYRTTSTGGRKIEDLCDDFYRFQKNGSRLRFIVKYNDKSTSTNPRCELREMTKKRSGENKDKTAKWSTNTSSTKQLKFKSRVTSVPKNSRLCVAQVHSGGSAGDIIQVIVERNNGDTYKLKVRTDGASGNDVIYSNNYSLNSDFDFTIQVKNNQVKFKKGNGNYTTRTINSNARTSICYFKVGAYLLGATYGSGKVEFTDIAVNRYEDY